MVGAKPKSAEGALRLDVIVRSAGEEPEVDGPAKPPGAGCGWFGIGCNEGSAADREVCVGIEVGPGSVDSGDAYEDVDEDENGTPGIGVGNI